MNMESNNDDNPVSLNEMLAIEIHFGKGRKDIVNVHFDDKPDDLATKFVAKHKLKISAIPIITSHIANTIAEFLENNAEIRPQSPDQVNDGLAEFTTDFIDRNTLSNDMQSAQPPVELPSSPPIDKQINEISNDKISLVNNTNESNTDMLFDKKIDNQINNTIDNERDNKIDSNKLNNYIDIKPSNKLVSNKVVSSNSDNRLTKNVKKLESPIDSKLDKLFESIKHEFSSDSQLPDYNKDTTTNSPINREIINNATIESINSPVKASDELSNSISNDNVSILENNNSEQLYNRMKSIFSNKSMNNISINSLNSSNRLRPSSSTLSLNKTNQLATQLTNHKKKQNINEKLYNNAKQMQLKKEKIFKQNEKIEKIQLLNSQFKINENSRQILSSRHIATGGDKMNINERLYVQSVDTIERKKQIESINEVIDELPSLDWSCARCGTLHRVRRPPIYLSTSLTHLNNSINNTINYNIAKVCSNCSFDQTNVNEFKPINIGLINHSNPNELLNKRNKYVDSNHNIHEYLYYNKIDETNKLMKLQALTDMNDIDNTFHPNIPESSKIILQKLYDQPVDKSVIDDKIDLSNDQMKSNFKLVEYFNQPAHKRLYETTTRPTNQLTSQQTSRSNSVKRSSKEIESLINRLNIEKIVKKKKIENLRKNLNIFDEKTGKKLYQPTISSLPSYLKNSVNGLSNDETNNKENVFDKLNNYKIKSKFKSIDNELLNNPSVHQVKANDKSNEIVNHSTNQNIKEIYRLLVSISTVNQLYITNKIEKENFQTIIEKINYLNEQLENSLEDTWIDKEINLLHVNNDLLIEQVKNLIIEIKNDPIVIDNNYLLNYKMFNELVMKTIRSINPIGKSYIIIPKIRSTSRPNSRPSSANGRIDSRLDKRIDRTIGSAIASDNEFTFKPKLFKYENHRHRPNDLSVYDMLYSNAKLNKMKLEEKRKILNENELKNYTFQPKLFKLPANVIPKRRESTVRESLDKIDSNAEDNDTDKRKIYSPISKSMSPTRSRVRPSSASKAIPSVITSYSSTNASRLRSNSFSRYSYSHSEVKSTNKPPLLPYEHNIKPTSETNDKVVDDLTINRTNRPLHRWGVDIVNVADLNQQNLSTLTVNQAIENILKRVTSSSKNVVTSGVTISSSTKSTTVPTQRLSIGSISTAES